MPRLLHRPPKYRKHKASGQAVVTIAGKDHYLGPYNSKASKLEYDRLVGEWLAAGRPAQAAASANAITVTEVAARFWTFAASFYRKHGDPTGTAENYKPALRLLRQAYGKTSAAAFGPLALKSLQQRMIEAGHSRRYLNDNIDRIRRVFKWAASEELIPGAVPQALATVENLRKDRSAARETPPVLPVSDAMVDATLPFLPVVVADMVRFQRLTGARPGEVCMLRPCDVDCSSEVWVYMPASHKTEHHGRARVICIGPKAQDVLRPYLLRDKTAYCFQPRESEKNRNAERRERRASPMTPSQASRRPRRRRSRAPSDRYTNDSYRRAIHRACELAFQMPVALRRTPKDEAPEASIARRKAAKEWRDANTWHPNQLRHSAATEIRKRFGLEAAQVALGHAQASVTQVYAERDLAKAAAVMKEVG